MLTTSLRTSSSPSTRYAFSFSSHRGWHDRPALRLGSPLTRSESRARDDASALQFFECISRVMEGPFWRFLGSESEAVGGAPREHDRFRRGVSAPSP